MEQTNMFPKGTFRNVPTETRMKPTRETTKQKKGLQPNKLFTKPTLKQNNTENFWFPGPRRASPPPASRQPGARGSLSAIESFQFAECDG